MNPDRSGKMRIPFLCTGNSCRSQMAEGWTRHLKGNVIEPYSAGIETHGLDQYAMQVMAKTQTEAVDCCRRVRDQIRDLVEKLPDIVRESG
ncbi:MAG: hypothetical protein JSW66_12995 [Phycisphaerales bacterium]|nr:MAG: hypothetical protein JSW66_12995 [Phycisphaerales bacterium]